MTSKWTTTSLPGEANKQGIDTPLVEQYAVVLLHGKNSFGDMIYSYVKIFLPNIQKFKAAVQAGKGFNPSDFGEVLAAGKGNPPPEVHAEMVALYPLIENNSSSESSGSVSNANNGDKKAWDEY